MRERLAFVEKTYAVRSRSAPRGGVHVAYSPYLYLRRVAPWLFRGTDGGLDDTRKKGTDVPQLA